MTTNPHLSVSYIKYFCRVYICWTDWIPVWAHSLVMWLPSIKFLAPTFLLFGGNYELKMREWFCYWVMHKMFVFYPLLLVLQSFYSSIMFKTAQCNSKCQVWLKKLSNLGKKRFLFLLTLKCGLGTRTSVLLTL